MIGRIRRRPVKRPRDYILTAGATAAVLAAGSAGAATPCAKAIQDEWAAGQIATTHELSCYDAALEEAQGDVLLYSDFVEQVLTAKRRASQAQRSTATLEPAAPPPPAASPAPPPPRRTESTEPAPPPPPPAPTPPAAEPVAPPVAEPPPSEPVQPSDGAAAAPAPVFAPAAPAPPAPAPSPPAAAPAPAAPARTVAPAPVPAPQLEAAPELDVVSGSPPAALVALALVSGLLALSGATLFGMRLLESRRTTPVPRRRTGTATDDDTTR
jgi:hypothetical protein